MSLIPFQNPDQDHNANNYRPLGTICRRCVEVLEAFIIGADVVSTLSAKSFTGVGAITS